MEGGSVRSFLNRHRHEASLVLGFMLLFTFMGHGAQPDRPWFDWTVFAGGVIAFAVITRKWLFEISIPLFYGPLLAFFIFGGITSVSLGKGWIDLSIGVLIPATAAGVTWGIVKIIERTDSKNS
jgi:hypothetical protein